jgi:SAM-dependent methyltransferase
MERTAWALRRLHCPVAPDALVLEVGSGGNPYARANVLMDAYEETRERHWVPLTSDRPTVLGYAENPPFKDQAFDFVIASHVLEHSTDPVRFLNELQRVAKAGYIEVPDAFMERINPYRDHRLEITMRQGKLVIRKKPQWVVDNAVVDLYNDRAKPLIAGKLIPSHPFEFHVRYYWSNHIDFTVLNPEIDASWQSPEDTAVRSKEADGGMKKYIVNVLRHLMSQRRRNRNIDLLSLLRCPTCHDEHLERGDTCFYCHACGASYEMRRGIAVLYSQNKEGSSCPSHAD